MVEYDSSSSPRTNIMFLAALVVLGAVVIMLVLVRNRVDLPDGARHPAAGVSLTRLELEPLVNTSQRLTLPDLAGQVVLVNFWGPWCGPCRIEMPHLVSLEKSFRRREDFQLVSVSCGIGGVYSDARQLKEQTAAFVRQNEVEFPVFYDPHSQSRLALRDAAQLREFGYPTTVLLDRNAVIRGLWQGYSPGIEDEMRQLIERTLAEG